MLTCPYCATELPAQVKLAGQIVICPKCSSQVQVPDATGAGQAAAGFQLLFAVAAIALGVLAMLRGCAFSDLANSL